MRAGIVGLGKMGLLHMGILNSLPDIKMIAITETEKKILNYVKSSLPTINTYSDYNEMLNSEKLDLVYITTPIQTHVPIAMACLEKNCNFFIEKPVSRNLGETKQLHDKLKNTGIIHGVGYNRRFIDTFVKTKSLLEANVLGDISSVTSSMYASNVFKKSFGWRADKKISGGGVLLDFGSHLVDLLLWYFGKISHVSGHQKSLYSAEVEDEAHMEIFFESGIHGTLDTSWSIKGYRLPEINIQINGKNGNIKVTEDHIKVNLTSPTAEFTKNETMIYKQSLNKGVPIDIAGSDYTKEDLHMIECIKNGHQSLVNVFEASKAQSAIEAMYLAAKSGKKETVEYVG